MKDLLSAKLNEIGFTAETVYYSRPLLSQHKDADVVVNGLSTVDNSIVDAIVSKIKASSSGRYRY